jgi:MFS-type transporter involved in bile tolerance (Atg22 family)
VKKLSKNERKIEDTEEQLEKRKKKRVMSFSLYAVGSTLCVVISINMYYIPIYFIYHILNFYVIIML